MPVRALFTALRRVDAAYAPPCRAARHICRFYLLAMRERAAPHTAATRARLLAAARVCRVSARYVDTLLMRSVVVCARC